MWIATSDDHVAAAFAHTTVVAAYESWARRVLEFDGPVRMLQAVAVSVEWQGRGLSADAMSRAFEDILRCEGKQTTLAMCMIDQRNGRSQKMAQREGLKQLKGLPVGEPHLEYWATVLEAGS